MQRACVRHCIQHEPLRKVDLLLSNALIEARSCERFGLLAPRLAEPLGSFYGTLARSEARHFELYVKLRRRRKRDRFELAAAVAAAGPTGS